MDVTRGWEKRTQEPSANVYLFGGVKEMKKSGSAVVGTTL